jgi:hypothetical protein
MTDKARERTFVDTLLSSQVDLSGFSIVESEERPDFLLQQGERIVGLEVTELFHQPAQGSQPRQEKESLERRLCATAQRLWNGQSLPTVHVALHFSPFHRLSKRSIPEIAARLVHLVAHAVPEPGKRVELDYDWTNRDVHPEEVPHLRVHRFDDNGSASWTHSDAEWGRPLTPSQIQLEIDRKAQLVSRYRTRVPEVWLLLGVDGFRLSASSRCPIPRPSSATGHLLTGCT